MPHTHARVDAAGANATLKFYIHKTHPEWSSLGEDCCVEPNPLPGSHEGGKFDLHKWCNIVDVQRLAADGITITGTVAPDIV